MNQIPADPRAAEMKADLAVIEKRLERLQAAAKLTLLFYSGEMWDTKRQLEWERLLAAAHGGLMKRNCEAGTKILCDAVRAALEG